MTEKDSPIIAQYKKLKTNYSDCILFFQIGEFYEIFADDAYVISKLLGLTLSYKTKQKVPMCGFPCAALEVYVYRIMSSGYKIALCQEIIIDKSITREVVRVFTQGTVVEENLLDPKSSNFILCYYEDGPNSSYVICDISIGQITIGTSFYNLETLLVTWDPVECFVDESIITKREWKSLSDWHDRFSFVSMTDLEKYYGFADDVYSLQSLSQFNGREILCIGVVIEYIKKTQKQAIRHLKFPRRNIYYDSIHMDPFTIANLEIFKTLQGNKADSLYELVRNTITGPGHRLLRARFQRPSTVTSVINDRLDGIEFFLKQNIPLHKYLLEFADIERIIARLGFKQSNLRDMLALMRSLGAAESIYKELSKYTISYEIDEAVQYLVEQEVLLRKMEAAFVHSDDASYEKGKFIKPGFYAEIDKLKASSKQIFDSISFIRARYAHDTGMANMQIKYIDDLGFIVEIPKSKALSMSYSFRMIQDLKKVMRYTTGELTLLSEELAEMTQKIRDYEHQIFAEFVELILSNQKSLTVIAESIGIIDVAYSMAQSAYKNNYVRPKIATERSFKVKQGKHIVLAQQVNNVIANDCWIDSKNTCLLMTGPNMSGKTTFLKQNAIIALLTHVGLFVPAESAEMSIIDAIFVRVGAHDNLAKGMSTFMVEMYELARICTKLTQRSFVVIDEIGRGTSADEGIGIACAVLEHLEEQKIRSIFATHYSILTSVMPELKQVTMEVDYNNERIFSYRVKDGQTEISYALFVGKMAGIPNHLLRRSAEWSLILTPSSIILGHDFKDMT